MKNTPKNQTRFLNLTRDLIFKNYFKHDKNLLKSLLKTFLPLPAHTSIKDIAILDSLIPSLTPEEKSSLMDLRVQMEGGGLVNVEMQAFPHKSFTQRILLYWAKNYSSGLKTGEDYKDLYPAYSLVFSAYDLFPGKEDFYTSFSIRSDKSPHFCFNEDLRFVTVELSKFKKREPSALLDLREDWCYLLKESGQMGEKESGELSAKGEEMKRAVFHLKELSREEGLRLVEEAREKERRDQAARMSDSFKEGIEKGMARGKADGLVEGMEKGKRELVMSMLRNGLDVSLISKIAGFSEAEVSKLHRSLLKR